MKLKLAKKFKPQEGTIIAIPLKPEGWVIGVYARVKKGRGNGVPFGYFFGKIYPQIPDMSTIGTLEPKNAILQTKFGDLGLVEGRWSIIGTLKPWERSNWPMPDMMIPADELTPFDQRIRLHEDDPSCEIERVRFPPGSLNLPSASVPGSLALQIILSMILRGEREPSNTLRERR